VRQSATTGRPVLPKHTAPPALLSLLLLSQPALAQEAQVEAQFEKVSRLENPLASPLYVKSSSKPTFVDIDNDGDMDAFIGSGDGSVTYYKNTGNANHPIFEGAELNNPLSGVKMQEHSYPTLVDIDDDNDLDAFIGGKKALSYYENTGDANQPIFEERTEQNHPLSGVALGEDNIQKDNIPTLTDIDNDGDLDAFIGTRVEETNDDGQLISYGIVKYFENTGNASQPVFEERTDTANPLESVKVRNNRFSSGLTDVESAIPSFVDIDNDSDLDVFIGTADGTVKYYENTGTADSPNFVQRFEPNTPLHGIDVGDHSVPTFIDIDNDTDLDSFIGTSDGTIKYYENTGTPNQPQFVERTKRDNPFGGIVDARVALTLVDIDQDGDIDAFATSDGPIKYYQNTGNVNQPTFVERSAQDNPLSVEIKSRPIWVDIDTDGDLDAFFIGGKSKKSSEKYPDYTIKYYENTGTATRPMFEERTDTANPLSEVEVITSQFRFVDMDYDGDLDFFQASNAKTYYENIGSVSQPHFAERIAPNHPFINIDMQTLPAVVDMDNDGKWEAITTMADGTMKYYQSDDTGVGMPKFVERTADENNPFAGLKVASYSTPTLVDMDNDGDLDAFITAENGTRTYYRNTSPVNQPAFVARQGQNNPLADINVTLSGQPALVDIDADKDIDAFFGTTQGTVVYYENTGTASQPVLVKRGNRQGLANLGDLVPTNPLANVKANAQIQQISLIDIDNDKDLDALINAGGGTVTYYENTGTPSQPHFVETPNSNNPFATVKFEHSFSLGDIDNDNDLDIFIRTMDKVKYYQNTGTATKPHFEERADINPLVEVEVRSMLWSFWGISLVDIDGDNDLDALIANKAWTSASAMDYYENIGTASQPHFMKREPHSLANWPIATLVDMDQDSDLDAILGDGYFVDYYENTGTLTQPNFVIPTENPFAFINIRLTNQPNFADIDNDSDLDVFIGTNKGTVKYYENLGTVAQPQFVESTNNPLAKAKVELDSIPTLVDIDQDHDLDAFIGTRKGTIKYYENLGTANQPQFEERADLQNPLAGIKINSLRQLVWIDFDNDGDSDVFITGETFQEQPANAQEQPENEVITSYPTVQYYENQGTGQQPQFVEKTQHNPLLAQIHPDSFRSLDFMDIDQDQDLDAVIGEDYHVVSYYENTGAFNKGQPVFVKQRTEQDNAITFRGYPTTFADIDNDGDWDAFGPAGRLTYYENLSLAARALPNPYALPRSGFYNRPQQVSLNCIDCEQIYYTLDGTTRPTSAIEYTDPIPLTANTTLNFVAIDAQAHLSQIQTEFYQIDTTLPEVKITSPASLRTFATLPVIEGTAVDEPKNGVGLDRVELKINNGPLYISQDSETPFTSSVTWLPLKQTSDSKVFWETAEVFRFSSTNSWYYDFKDRPFPNGTYTITARAFDKAGNVSEEDSITVTLGEPAQTELVLKLSNHAILTNDSLTVTGKLNRLPETEQTLADLPIELTITAPDGTQRVETTTTQSQTGQYQINLSGFTQPGRYTFKTTFAGAPLLLAPAESTQQSALVSDSAHELENQPPNPFNLRYPTDGASTRTALRFDWETTTDPDSDVVTYTLLIATDTENFYNSVVYQHEQLLIPVTAIDENTVINDGQTDETTGLEDLTTYYWKVEAFDNFGAKTTSPVFSFQTNNLENGGDNPINSQCDDTLENNNHCAKASADLQRLHVPAINALELGWYQAELQQTAENIFTLDNLEPIPAVQRPTDNEALYYPDTGELLIRTVAIEGLKKTYRATLRLVPNTEPLQFQLILEDIIPL
jgi:hypothetical protein